MSHKRSHHFSCVLLIAVTFAFFLSGCNNKPVEVEDEQAIKAVEAAGGKVVRDENMPGKPVVAVEFTKATDADLKALAPFKRLASLNLAGTQVGDAGLKELVDLQRLRSLDLTGTRVTDAGLKELAAIKNLHRLVLTDTQATEAGEAELQKALPYCGIQR